MSKHVHVLVLVVEDHLATGEMLQDLLEEEGYEVALAPNAALAAQLLAAPSKKRRPPDVVVLDLTMPGLDPRKMIRQVDPSALPPVILMSAKPKDALNEAAEEIGAVAVLHKPFSIDYFLRCVESAVAATEQRKPAPQP